MCTGQAFIKTSDLFPETVEIKGSGTLKIFQDPAIDTLISRHILSNKYPKESNGYRINIYLGRMKNARYEANEIAAQFMAQYPKVPSYIDFQPPNVFFVTVGNFRTKIEGTKLFIEIQKKYPGAFLTKHFIDYSDLNKE